MKWEIRIVTQVSENGTGMERLVSHNHQDNDTAIKVLNEAIEFLRQQKKPERSLDISVGEFVSYCNLNKVKLPIRFIRALSVRPEFNEMILDKLQPQSIYSLPDCGVRVAEDIFKTIIKYQKNRI